MRADIHGCGLLERPVSSLSRHVRSSDDAIQRAIARHLQQHLGQCSLNRPIGDVERAQLVPFFGVARKPIERVAFPRGTNGIKMLAIFGTTASKGDIFVFRHRQKARNGSGERVVGSFTNRAAQENPGTFLAPFGKAAIAQDADMARYTRLALAEHLRHFAHRQFHAGEKTHDAQARCVIKRADGVEMSFWLYQPPGPLEPGRHA